MRRVTRRARRWFGLILSALRARGKTKYFCIGRNKTGTTSLKVAFLELGFIVGDQRIAEQLHDKFYFRSIFRPIVWYCLTAQVFQDVPFSCPETFKHLDKAYPGSKFILTVRDSPDQWYQSILSFHTKKYGKDGRSPTAAQLKNAKYKWYRRGVPYNVVKLHGTPDTNPYDPSIMKAHYEAHNRSVIDYFRDRPEDLLVINVGNPDDWIRFLRFVGKTSRRSSFPWKKKTEDLPG